MANPIFDVPSYNILVVATSPAERTFLRQCFSACRHRCELTFASSIEEAHASLHCGHDHLVVLDLHLGPEDGLELLNRMRSEPPLAFIPVVVLSGSTGESVRAYSAGANALITKNADLAQYEFQIKSMMDFWVLVATLPAAF